MEHNSPKAPIPWPTLIISFVLTAILLVSLCLAILDPSQMELLRMPRHMGCFLPL